MGHTGKYVLRFWGLSFTEVNYMKFVYHVKNLRMYVKVLNCLRVSLQWGTSSNAWPRKMTFVWMRSVNTSKDIVLHNCLYFSIFFRIFGLRLHTFFIAWNAVSNKLDLAVNSCETFLRVANRILASKAANAIRVEIKLSIFRHDMSVENVGF